MIWQSCVLAMIIAVVQFKGGEAGAKVYWITLRTKGGWPRRKRSSPYSRQSLSFSTWRKEQGTDRSLSDLAMIPFRQL